MKHCETGAVQAIRDAQQATGKLQAEVVEKDTAVSKLQSECDILHTCKDKSVAVELNSLRRAVLLVIKVCAFQAD
jgi:hypothetical protein